MTLGRRYVLTSGLALGTAALAGCGSPVVSQYRLAAMPGNLRDLGQLSVSVRSITIPGYLDQNAILKPGSAYQVNRFGNAVWAEPLADMLQAVLVADLSQRLGGGNVFASGTIGQPADKVVEVAVQRFDFDPDGELNLTAQLAVKTAAGTAWVTQSFQQLATPAGADAADIAASMSGMWGGAADKLAAMLQAG